MTKVNFHKNSEAKPQIAEVLEQHNKNNITLKLSDGTVHENIVRKEFCNPGKLRSHSYFTDYKKALKNNIV